MRKKAIIVGAGISGLSAGCYLQMNGYDTEIFELRNLPGGLCTSWKRKDFTIDGCIHWLVGSSPQDNFYHLWNELIDMEKIEFVYHNEYMRVELENGEFIRVFTDIDKLKQEFLEKAPEDRKIIIEFTDAVKKFLPFTLPIEKAPETYTIMDGVKLIWKILPYWRAMKNWSGISLKEYAGKCNNPLLKKTIENMFMPEMSAFFIIMTLVWMHKKSAGYPIGGSLRFAQLIERKYGELGGTINYRSKVTRIMTENDSATGIILESGETHTADLVISAADGHYTLFEMLEGKYIDEKNQNYYDNYETFPSYIQISLGVARRFENEPHCVVFPLEHRIVLDNSTQKEDIWVRIFNFDPTLAPEGKTLITVMFVTGNYTYWVDLKENQPEKYQKEKERIADEVIYILEKKLGNIRSKVEVIDVSTPATVIRYTNNWKGSFEGWILSPKTGFRSMKKVLPGLRNFYMIGQWVEPGGGLPSAIMSGRNVTQLICKKDKKRFRTAIN